MLTSKRKKKRKRVNYNRINSTTNAIVLVTFKMIFFYFPDAAKELFRETNGIQNVLSHITKTKQDEVLEAGLYCLGSAVERNGKTTKFID